LLDPENAEVRTSEPLLQLLRRNVDLYLHVRECDMVSKLIAEWYITVDTIQAYMAIWIWGVNHCCFSNVKDHSSLLPYSDFSLILPITEPGIKLGSQNVWRGYFQKSQPW
jgi:hypothetical protein